jgi:hypothetical protein
MHDPKLERARKHDRFVAIKLPEAWIALCYPRGQRRNPRLSPTIRAERLIARYNRVLVTNLAQLPKRLFGQFADRI